MRVCKNLKKSPKIADSAVFKVEDDSQRSIARKAKALYSQMGKDQVIEMLVESGSKQAVQLAEMLQDPRYDPDLGKTTFPVLYKKCGLTLKDIAHMYEQHQTLVGKLRLMRHIPDILEDVAIDSKSKELSCIYCSGTGKMLQKDPNSGTFVPSSMLCAECRGQGFIRQIGDKDSRTLAFETAGFTKKGPLIDQRSVTINAGDGQALASLVRKTTLILEAHAAEDE